MRWVRPISEAGPGFYVTVEKHKTGSMKTGYALCFGLANDGGPGRWLFKPRAKLRDFALQALLLDIPAWFVVHHFLTCRI